MTGFSTFRNLNWKKFVYPTTKLLYIFHFLTLHSITLNNFDDYIIILNHFYLSKIDCTADLTTDNTNLSGNVCSAINLTEVLSRWNYYLFYQPLFQTLWGI